MYKHSGYTRTISYTDTTDYQLRKVVYYDRKNALLKTLTFSDYQIYLDKYWRAHNLYMENHVTKKTTTLRSDEYEFQTGLTQADFNQDSLKRAR